MPSHKTIYEVEEGRVYLSGHGYRMQVLHRAPHGQDCQVPMVVYTNLDATWDCPPGQVWVVSESFFLSRFREERDHIQITTFQN